jgi:hypothetical protein
MTGRAYIPYPERLAAALACLLPQEHRDDLRQRMVDSAAVLGLFHFHHITFHANRGSDFWWNLHPMLNASHRERTRTVDIPAIAKGKRLTFKHEEFRRRILAKEPGKSARPPSRWPKRAMKRWT